MRRARAGSMVLLVCTACGPSRASAPPVAPTTAVQEQATPATDPGPSTEIEAEPSTTRAIAPDPDPLLGSLAWLAGTWVSDDDDPRTVEHWLPPEGGTMIGVNRSVAGGTTVFFEYLRIVADERGVAYLASPQGRDPPTRFDRVDEAEGFVAFENPAHDFPQRIEYRREADRLTMTISGEKDGAARASRWTMHRAPLSP